MNIVNTHFANLAFTKVSKQGDHYMYVAKIYDKLVEKRKKYITLFVPADGFLSSTLKIKDLPWVNLQTRYIEWEEGDKIKAQKWDHDTTINPELNVFSRSKDKTTYTCPSLPQFEISLLHVKKKTSGASNSYQYHSTMPLSVALETFNCNINKKSF